MDIFVDLSGATGATYRFRTWPEGGHASMAGNFAVVEFREAGIAVRMVGVTNDLSKAKLHATTAGFGDKPLYVRLNVGRALREQEHDDIVANYRPDEIFEAGA